MREPRLFNIALSLATNCSRVLLKLERSPMVDDLTITTHMMAARYNYTESCWEIADNDGVWFSIKEEDLIETKLWNELCDVTKLQVIELEKALPSPNFKAIDKFKDKEPSESLNAFWATTHDTRLAAHSKWEKEQRRRNRSSLSFRKTRLKLEVDAKFVTPTRS